MKLDDALAKTVRVSPKDQDWIFLEGFLALDTEPEYFRIYPKPLDRTVYFRLARQDVDQEIHEYSPEELRAGAFKEPWHRVKVPRGTALHLITIQSLKAGERQVGFKSPRPKSKKDKSFYCFGPDPTCQATCGHTCPCSEIDDHGYPNCSDCCIA